NAAGGDGTDIGAIEMQVCNHPPVAQCKNIQVSASNACRASITAAQVDNNSFDPDPGDAIATRALDNAGPFGPGPHTVTLTVTVVDTTPPTITCPANISMKLVGPVGSCMVVNYPAPVATDNCGATTVCTPPSGTCFPQGTTTVTCTATDSAGLTAHCAFTVT